MHEIYFYRDKSGKRPVADYLAELAGRKDEDSRIKLKKHNDYIQALSEYGLQLGEPYIKHIDGDIWELRPISDRVFFVAWTGGNFVLLHQFVKKTQKTPAREIAQAKRELADLKERGFDENE
ncbi:MAG: type II toxin-antitoxin system RelE/ParE family toxin [Oscillospiraceae bacterium]|nr:type II toxin-antitoxin system RelE/ParE family toxin [Oscillospiraceae bacterium]